MKKIFLGFVIVLFLVGCKNSYEGNIFDSKIDDIILFKTTYKEFIENNPTANSLTNKYTDNRMYLYTNRERNLVFKLNTWTTTKGPKKEIIESITISKIVSENELKNLPVIDDNYFVSNTNISIGKSKQEIISSFSNEYSYDIDPRKLQSIDYGRPIDGLIEEVYLYFDNDDSLVEMTFYKGT